MPGVLLGMEEKYQRTIDNEAVKELQFADSKNTTISKQATSSIWRTRV